jgi:hypothetical protein
VLLDVLRQAVVVAGKAVSSGVCVLEVEVLGIEEAFGLLDCAIELDPIVS